MKGMQYNPSSSNLYSTNLIEILMIIKWTTIKKLEKNKKEKDIDESTWESFCFIWEQYYLIVSPPIANFYIYNCNISWWWSWQR